jgi:predicted phage-related endonuclease
MLGVSPYKTRTELLHELHTGISPEVNTATQRRFDSGHAAEAAARPVAEREIGEELYPVVGSEGKLSASFDGLTMDGRIVWEHKLMNVDLADSLANGIIPDSYHPQLEQQLMVSGAEKALFMATSPDRTAMECVWYTSNPELRSRILQGWTQFAIDLAAYVPTVTEAKPQGRAPETLPALHIEVTGMVTASNLAEYKAQALAVFGSINRDLVTDQDFASAESTVKWCGDIETRVAAAKQHALGQTASIDALFRALDEISAEARTTRLELDKLVKNRKDSIRAEIVSDGRNALADHMTALTARIGAPLMPAVPVDFAAAIKGKRTLDSMRDAVSVELARAKIAANEIADRISFNLRVLDANKDLAFLFNDRASIVLKHPEDLQMLVTVRINEHKAKETARLEAERARIEQQERIKAEAAAKARADAEIAAATALAQQDAARASAEAIAKAQAEQPKPTPASVSIAPVAIESAAKKAPVCESVQVEQTTPTLRLGQIADRLGFVLKAEFLKQLGFEPAGQDRAAVLFHEADFLPICRALIEHIETACEMQAA